MKCLKFFCVIFCFSFLLIACKKECVHQYQSRVTQQATCTQEGEETFTCTLCQDSYTQSIPVIDHSYEVQATEKEATCTEEGLQLIRCTVCNAEERSSIEKIPHTLENTTILKEANCTQEGQVCGDCTVCGAQQVTEKTPTNNVHIFTNTVNREATCADAGAGTNTCQLCQYSEPCQYELKEHTYSNKNVLTEAGCTENGEQECTCVVCGHYMKETIPAFGHSWSGATCQVASVCATCGATGSRTSHNYTTITDKEPSKTFAGYRIKKCTTCDSEKKEYYTTNYRFDLDAMAAELSAYASAKGFTPLVDSFDDPDKGISLSVLQLDGYDGGPDKLLSTAKRFIQELRDKLTSGGAGLEKRAMHIYLWYGQNGAIGGGFFGVYLKTSIYD